MKKFATIVGLILGILVGIGFIVLGSHLKRVGKESAQTEATYVSTDPEVKQKREYSSDADGNSTYKDYYYYTHYYEYQVNGVVYTYRVQEQSSKPSPVLQISYDLKNPSKVTHPRGGTFFLVLGIIWTLVFILILIFVLVYPVVSRKHHIDFSNNTIFTCILTGIAFLAFFIAFARLAWYFGREWLAYQEVQAEYISSDSYEITGEGSGTLHTHYYRYAVDGEVYEYVTQNSKTETVGAMKTLRYDPNNPSKATGESKLLSMFVTLIFASMAIGTGVAGFLLLKETRNR